MTTVRPTTAPSDATLDRILDPLRTVIDSGRTDYRVFDDWVSLMLASIQGDEQAYLDIADAYDREALDAFARAFGRLVRETRETELDVIGDVYERLGVNSDSFAQHFTPHDVSAFLAGLNPPSDTADDSPPTIADPTCGSGRLLVAAARRVDEGVFVGVDKDAVCAKMAVVNCWALGLDAYIVHGDSLSLEAYHGWQTTATPTGGAVRDLDEETARRVLETPVSE
jgi:hypothetical protein